MNRSHHMAGGYITYAAIGASFLWPWNAVITAGALAKQHLAQNPTLLANYSSAIMTISTVVGLGMNVWLASRPGRYELRVRWGEILIAVAFLCFALSDVFSLTAASWFWAAVIVAGVSSVGTALVQSGAMSITQRIPGGDHALAMMNGQALAGVIPPIMSILFGTSPSVEAVSAPFVFSSVTLLALLALFMFESKSNAEFVAMAQHEVDVDHDMPPVKLLKQIWAPSLSIFIGFIVSLSYPVFANTIESKSISAGIWVPLVHLVWNSGDLAGRVLCEAPRFRIVSDRGLVTYSVARFVLILALLLLARFGNPSDLVYLLVQLIYGTTGGHLTSSAISITPKRVAVHFQPAAGGLISLVIALGLAAGALVSFIIVKLLAVFE